MKRIIQAHIYKGEEYYIAECIDLPVVTQGKTLDELAKNLNEAVGLQLEDEKPECFDLIQKPSILMSIELDCLNYAKA